MSNFKKELSTYCIKHTKYIELFNKFIKHGDDKFGIDIFKSVYDKLTVYNHIIKNSSYDPLSSKSIEELDDKISAIISENQAKSFMKSFISSKYSKICDEDTSLLFRAFFDLNISKSSLRELILSKMAKFKTSKEFNTALRKTLKGLSSFNRSYILNKSKEVNTEIAYDSNNILVLRINDYKASKKMGASSWCISSDHKYFNHYVKESKIDKFSIKFNLYNNQLFVWNFNLSIEDPLSLIGVTVSSSGKLVAAHDKFDHEVYSSKLAKSTGLNFKKIGKQEDKIILEAIRESSNNMFMKYLAASKLIESKSIFIGMTKHLLKQKSFNLSQAYLNTYLNHFLFNKTIEDSDHDYELTLRDAIDFYQKNINDSSIKEEILQLNFSFFLLRNIKHSDFDSFVNYAKELGIFDTITDDYSSYDTFINRIRTINSGIDQYYSYITDKFCYLSYVFKNTPPSNSNEYLSIISILDKKNDLSQLNTFFKLIESDDYNVNQIGVVSRYELQNYSSDKHLYRIIDHLLTIFNVNKKQLLSDLVTSNWPLNYDKLHKFYSEEEIIYLIDRTWVALQSGHAKSKHGYSFEDFILSIINCNLLNIKDYTISKIILRNNHDEKHIKIIKDNCSKEEILNCLRKNGNSIIKDLVG